MKKYIDIIAPTAWNELTLKQLRYVAKVMMMPEMERTQASIMLFCLLSGIRMRKNIKGTVFFKMGRQRFTLEPYQLMDFCSKFDYIFDSKPVDVVNPTKIDPHLIDVKFNDYYFANAMMIRYSQTMKRSCVRMALKALGQRVFLMSKTTAYMVFVWWSGVQTYLHELYPNVFDSSGVDSDKTSYQILMDIFLMLNDNHPQDNKEIGESDLHAVLSALDNKIEQNKKEREALKK